MPPNSLSPTGTTLATLASHTSASSSDRAILSIAVGLMARHVDKPFGELVDGLDTTNATHVLNAIAHTCGWHADHHSAVIDGDVP